MVALHLKSLPSSEESRLEWTHWGPRIFCCHWLLKLQLLCICRRRKWARKGKKSLVSVFGAVSKHRLCGVLCEIVHFILLLFNKDSDREFWKGKIDPNPHTKNRTNVTLFQPLMKRLLCHFTPYLTQFHVTSLQELSWYFFCPICFTLQIDHFGFLEDGVFKQRYLVADKHWQQPGGPIFFYTGNEGDITWFCNNTVNIPPAFQTACAKRPSERL